MNSHDSQRACRHDDVYGRVGKVIAFVEEGVLHAIGRLPVRTLVALYPRTSGLPMTVREIQELDPSSSFIILSLESNELKTRSTRDVGARSREYGPQ